MRRWAFIVFVCSIIAYGHAGYEYRYWFDYSDKNSITEKIDTPFIKINVDVSDLTETLHTINFQVKDSDNVWSSPISRCFIKVPQLVENTRLLCICNIDDLEYSKVNINAENLGFIEIDASKISQGIHKINIQLYSHNGRLIVNHDGFFLKIPTTEDLKKMKLDYTIDGISHNRCKCEVNGEIYHVDLDLKELSDGIHSIKYRLVNELGHTTQSQTSYFFKVPLGGNGIKQCEYWINDDVENKQLKVYDIPQDSISLVSLFKIKQYPIRSSCFHFEMDDSIPVLYAKNDFYIKFIDNGNRIRSISAQFIDESVKEVLNVEDIKVVKSGKTETISNIANGSIRWYKFYAEEGDSLTFKTSKTCTIQVFSPKGDERYCVNGVNALIENGFYADVDGVYYISIHDVTSTTGVDLKVDFKLIDKYALIDYSPNRSSNLGRLFFDLHGNGFKYLTDIMLTNNDTTIISRAYNILDNANVKGYFDLNNIPKGLYALKLMYLEGEKVDSIIKENAIVLEDAVYGDIQIIIDHVPTIERPYPIKIRIKNTGNVPYWGIPFNIAYDNIEEVKSLKFKNFGVLWNDCLFDSGYQYSYIIDNLFESELRGCLVPMVIPQINPYEEIILELGANVVASRFNLYAWAGNPWSEWKPTITPYNNPICRNLPNMYDAADMAGDIAGEFIGELGGSIPAEDVANLYLGIGEVISGIVIGLEHKQRKAQRDTYGSDFDMIEGYLPNYCPLRSPAEIVNDALPSIFKSNTFRTNKTKGNSKSLGSYNPNCPYPKPTPEPILMRAAYDPNDIIGYVSESGSHYIGNHVKDITYIIEFENDSTMSTAPAHRILLSDTLDSKVFDLSSVVPIKMQIGHKVYDFSDKKVVTMDMRPSINAIAQISVDISDKGIFECILETLDPITMEPAKLPIQGILPINNSEGRGAGFVSFNVNLKEELDDGTEIANMASIIFDRNEAIPTPYWINETDYINPVSYIDTLTIENDSTINIHIKGLDERSGIWKYDIYYQPGTGADWVMLTEGITDNVYSCHVFEDIPYNFCSIATDKAGNKESKKFGAEYTYINGNVTSNVEIIKDDVRLDDNELYDLFGRKVNEENLTPGIYILNGEKILIK